MGTSPPRTVVTSSFVKIAASTRYAAFVCTTASDSETQSPGVEGGGCTAARCRGLAPSRQRAFDTRPFSRDDADLTHQNTFSIHMYVSVEFHSLPCRSFRGWFSIFFFNSLCFFFRFVGVFVVLCRYADCIFLFPSSVVDGDTRAAEEATHLAAKAVRRYIDRTPTDEVSGHSICPSTF